MADEHLHDRYAALDDAIDRVVHDMTHTAVDAGAESDAAAARVMARINAVSAPRVTSRRPVAWLPSIPRAAWAVAAVTLLAVVGGYAIWSSRGASPGPKAATVAVTNDTPAASQVAPRVPPPDAFRDAPQVTQSGTGNEPMPATRGTRGTREDGRRAISGLSTAGGAQGRVARAKRGDAAGAWAESDAWTSDLAPSRSDLAVDNIMPTPLETPAALVVAPLLTERVVVERIPIEPAIESAAGTESEPKR